MMVRFPELRGCGPAQVSLRGLAEQLEHQRGSGVSCRSTPGHSWVSSTEPLRSVPLQRNGTQAEERTQLQARCGGP